MPHATYQSIVEAYTNRCQAGAGPVHTALLLLLLLHVRKKRCRTTAKNGKREGKALVGNQAVMTVLLMAGGDVSEVFPAIEEGMLLVAMSQPMRYSWGPVW